MTRLLLKNADYIITCDDNDNVFENCDILVEDKQIKLIAKNIISDTQVDETINCSGKAIFPGLVNTHHHFFQTFVRNRLSIDYPSMTVSESLDKLYRVFCGLAVESV